MEVNISRLKLIAKLKENRELHKQLHQEAVIGFVAAAKKKLAAAMKEMEDGKITDVTVALRAPEDHTRDYDVAIDMFEWAYDDTIRMNEGQFQTFVRDEWEWTRSWFRSNRRYSYGFTGCTGPQGSSSSSSSPSIDSVMSDRGYE